MSTETAQIARQISAHHERIAFGLLVYRDWGGIAIDRRVDLEIAARCALSRRAILWAIHFEVP